MHRWRLNDWVVTAPVTEPECVWPSLSVTYLPLQIPLRDDKHFVVGLVNTGEEPLDIARGVQEAVLWVDGQAWPSAAGRVWNGPYLLRPGHTTMRALRLADFPGAPACGAHEVALGMAGRRSAPHRVQWHGSSWRTLGEDKKTI